MSPEDASQLPVGAGIFLLFVGLVTDGLQLLAEFLLIGLILDPVFSVVTTMIFWIVLNHNNISMFSGTRAWAAWVNEIIEIAPVADGFAPGWTAYALYLTAAGPVGSFVRSILS